MSDESDLVHSDELQDEYESAQRRQSSRDAVAAGIAPPKHLIRSYDREVVWQDNPPSYSENTADVSSKDQQQQRGHQQSAEYGDYPRPSGQVSGSYNEARHPQFQQQALQQSVDAGLPSTTVTIPADYQVVRVIQCRSQSSRGWLWLTVIIIKLVIIVPILIIVLSSTK